MCRVVASLQIGGGVALQFTPAHGSGLQLPLLHPKLQGVSVYAPE